MRFRAKEIVFENCCPKILDGWICEDHSNHIRPLFCFDNKEHNCAYIIIVSNNILEIILIATNYPASDGNILKIIVK
jgi:hypothetical protein